LSFRNGVTAAAIALLVSAPASAQSGGRRGTAAAADARGHVLEATVAVAGAIDTEPFADSGAAGPNASAAESTFYSRARAGLNYRFRSPRLTVSLSGASAVDHYPSFENLVLATHDASAGLSARLGERASLNVRHGVAFAPFYTLQYGGLEAPDALTPAVAPSADFAVGRADSWRQSTSVDFSRRLGRRIHVAALYARSSLTSSEIDRVEHRAGVRLSHSFTRRMSVRAGYFRRFVTGAAISRVEAQIHEIDAGVDYARALSLTRRTTLNFGTGSAVLADDSSARLNLLGRVGLTHEIGRTWQATARYERALDFSEAVRGPVIANTAGLVVGGRLTPRITASAATSYVRGTSAGSDTYATESYGATARVGIALSRRLSSYAEYFFHIYDLGNAPLLVDVAREGRRHGARVGLSLGIPLAGESR
jgi:hypothetical protein